MRESMIDMILPIDAHGHGKPPQGIMPAHRKIIVFIGGDVKITPVERVPDKSASGLDPRIGIEPVKTGKKGGRFQQIRDDAGRAVRMSGYEYLVIIDIEHPFQAFDDAGDHPESVIRVHPIEIPIGMRIYDDGMVPVTEL